MNPLGVLIVVCALVIGGAGAARVIDHRRRQAQEQRAFALEAVPSASELRRDATNARQLAEYAEGVVVGHGGA